MLSDWPRVSLGNHCIKIGSGATPRGGSSVYLNTGEIRLIRSQNIYNDKFNPTGLVFIDDDAANSLKNVCVEENDVLLNITGDSVARVCLAEKEFLPARVNQHVAIIRPLPNSFDSRYLRYLLVSPTMQGHLLSLAGGGATRNALTKGMIESLEVIKPPLKVQIQVADKIEALDKKIKLHNQLNQTLESIAWAVFKSWFVDFDPVIDNALAAGNPIPEPFQARAERRRQRLYEGQSDFQPMPDELQQLFPDTFVETDDLKWVPRGWGIEKGESVATKIGMGPFGSNIKVSTFVEKGVPIISGKHLNEVELSGSDFNYITIEHADKLKNSKVWSGDLVFTHAGNIGQVSLIPPNTEFDEYVLSQRQFYLRPDPNKALGSYLIYFFRSHIGQHKLLSNASQVGVPSIARPTTHLKSIELLLPPLNLQHIFDERASILLNKVCLNKAQMDTLSSIRDALLPKLLYGQLRIPDGEAVVGEAVT